MRSIFIFLSYLFLIPPIHALPSSEQAIAAAGKPSININNATADNLVGSIKGIGEKRAQAIVSYREKHKEFKNLEELALVPGLGKNFVLKHKDEIQRTFILK